MPADKFCVPRLTKVPLTPLRHGGAFRRRENGVHILKKCPEVRLMRLLSTWLVLDALCGPHLLLTRKERTGHEETHVSQCSQAEPEARPSRYACAAVRISASVIISYLTMFTGRPLIAANQPRASSVGFLPAGYMKIRMW